MDMNEAWKKIDELKKNPDLANTPGYETDELRDSVDAIYWFLLLMEQPKFSPPDKWWFELRKRCDLPWAKLLAKQPQFEAHCHWESVSRLELVKLAYMASAIFEKHFPKCRPQDLWTFLTPQEKQLLLSDLPQLEKEVDWDGLDQEWDTGNWLMLLAYQPQFEKYFNWSRIEKKHSICWEHLLQRQPQFACHCDLELLEDWQIRRIKRKQPQFADKCDWDKLDGEDWAELLSKQPQFADKCDWGKLKGWNMAYLLSKQPQFADKCQWNELSGMSWTGLLIDQPQFADKCDWAKLDKANWA